LRFLFFPAAAVALICQLAILRDVVAGRTPASSHGPLARMAEIAWVVLPTMVLGIVLFATWVAVNAVMAVGGTSGVTA
jgi:hypothetical protein